MPPEPTRPEGVAGLPGRQLRGQFYRLVPQHLQDRALSPEGSGLYGGRYNPKRAFEALYCGEGPAVCWAEVRKTTGGRRLGPFVLASVMVKLQRVLDLTDHAVLQRLGLRPEDLVASDWAHTQELGRLARQAGFEALLVPSAAPPGRNLVLFPDRLNPASSVHLVSVEPAETENPNAGRSHGTAT